MSWTKLDDVNGNLLNLIKQAPPHEPIKIMNGKYRFHVSKRGSKYQVDMYGDGGGYFDTQVWSARRTKKQIERHKTAEITFSRP